MKISMTDTKANKAHLSVLEDNVEGYWTMMSKVYGIDIDNKTEVDELLNNPANADIKQQVTEALTKYKELKEEVRQTVIILKVVKAMKRNLICSVGEAEAAVSFVLDSLEIVRKDTEAHEPYATNTIKALTQSYRDVESLLENPLSNMEEDD